MDDTELLADAAGEFLNMVVGGAKAKFSIDWGPCSLLIPLSIVRETTRLP